MPEYRKPDDAEPAPPEEQPSRRLPVMGLLITGSLVAIVILAAVTIMPFVDPPENEVRTSASPGFTRSPHTVTGPLGSTKNAEFELAVGVATVVVRAADLGDNLYRASTAEGARSVPRVSQENGQVRLRVANVFDSDSGDEVTMELNQRVRWLVTMTGGSQSASVDLRSADLAGVNFVGGVARIELWLPAPKGEVRVAVSGGARDVVVHVPDGVPVRVGLSRGAAKATVDGSTRTGIAAGTRLTPASWNAARNRYDIDAPGGLGTLSVGR
ncbi:hypothetical protein [Virgisporangium aliadipatigenens]|uniref:hypothetical protein n=1 Tax=Virgisporangium aliadipatigenens TaxID=741659 RepID=UPI0019428515|nr:hypothetical protein [Virgisporangium aliadipatigenens]